MFGTMNPGVSLADIAAVTRNNNDGFGEGGGWWAWILFAILFGQVAQQLQWGQQSNYRDLTELINNQFCQLRMEQKDAVIAELQAKLNGCDRDTALQSMATYIINQVRPTPIPAWQVQNPWAGCGCGVQAGCCNNFGC